MTPEAALAIVPALGGADATITEIAGGLTNRTFRVDIEDRTFFLRLDDEHTALFGLDRQTEQLVLQTASANGLAPELIYSNPRQGILVTRIVAGTAWRNEDVSQASRVLALAVLLRRVHALPLSGVRFDASGIAKRYADNLRANRGLQSVARKCQDLIAALPVPDIVTCCHNDVVLENVIGWPEPKLIDWEYACDNDPLFDLASLIGYHDLPESTATELLEAYAGHGSNELRERLNEQLRLYDALQWLWLANRQIVSPDNSQAARLEDLQQRIR